MPQRQPDNAGGPVGMVNSGMVNCGAATYADPDHFQVSIRAADVDLVVTAGGRFEGSLTRIDFKSLWLQKGIETLPRIARIGFARNRAVLFFSSDHRHGFFSDGAEVRPDHLVLYEPGQQTHQRSVDGLGWSALSLTSSTLAALAEDVGLIVRIPVGGKHVIPSPTELQRLRRLHALAAGRARSDPDVLFHPSTCHALEQHLLSLFLRCTSLKEENPRGAAWRKRTRHLRQLDELLREDPEKPFYMLEICQKLGISERALQLCCQDHLGMSPSRYLRLRRLHLARRALQYETSAVVRVSDIAARFGFWEFGRFAVEYRRHFGESPSTTLRRPATEPAPMPLEFSEFA
ncbi:AraC family transcriptional regulator [Rhodopila sp.]|uniref:AraC family transcriptional regulator n=1 Tax=Rhodopila sp. TaxID=2480087 RepID=UPI002BCD64A7|nr:helix-turn-helix domain-containing protein [Rhodopila sp.]HVZ07854.1 helix-turn-helix domain-containing protein [Rhodopila sp.]